MVTTVLECPGKSWIFDFVLECPGKSRIFPLFSQMSLIISPRLFTHFFFYIFIDACHIIFLSHYNMYAINLLYLSSVCFRFLVQDSNISLYFRGVRKLKVNSYFISYILENVLEIFKFSPYVLELSWNLACVCP